MTLFTAPQIPPCSHSIDPDWVAELRRDCQRVRGWDRTGWPWDHMYPEQIRWPLLAWPTGGRRIPSDQLNQILRVSDRLFPEEQVYFVAYCEQVLPSGPHIDVVYHSPSPELMQSYRTVLVPLTEEPDHWTCTFDMWCQSHQEFDLQRQVARRRTARYPDQRGLWRAELMPPGLTHWVDRVRITHRMPDQQGLLHTWDVRNVHSSSSWDPVAQRDRPTRTFLLWHTLAPGEPLPRFEDIQRRHPWIAHDLS